MVPHPWWLLPGVEAAAARVEVLELLLQCLHALLGWEQQALLDPLPRSYAC